MYTLQEKHSGRAELVFSSLPKDRSNVHRFSNLERFLTVCTAGNHEYQRHISKLEKFKTQIGSPYIM